MLSSLCLHIFFLFFASVFTETLLPSSSSPIIQEISTRGAETNYEFYFQNPTEINSNANIRIIFPTQFNNPVILNQITPECYLYQNSVYSKVSCFKDSYYSYSIKVLCNKLDSSVKKLVIGPIINPSLDESSGAFKFYTLYEDGIVDMNENFGFVTFSNSPTQMKSASITPLSTLYMNQGSSFTLQFSTSNPLSSGNSLRLTFPFGFSSTIASCDVIGILGSKPKFETSANGRTVTCKSIEKNLDQSETVLIRGFKSPGSSGVFSGFKLEILEKETPKVLESISFDGGLDIKVNALNIELIRENMFKFQNISYTFKVTLKNTLDKNSFFYLNFTTDWILYKDNCTVITGISPSSYSCYKIPDDYSFLITNYDSIGGNLGIITINIELQTPKIEGEYLVVISTFSKIFNSIIDINSYPIQINSTYGVAEIFRPHALRPSIKLPSGESGAIELLYFLRTELPATDGTTEGKIEVNIYPKIPLPDQTKYGRVACFFYETIQSGNDGCTNSYQVLSDRTTITIYTPQLLSFKEHEIPIFITTTGPAVGYRPGILIDSLVKRYLFQIKIFKNGQSAYHESHYAEWIPNSIYLSSSDASIVSVTNVLSNKNYLQIKHTVKHDLLATSSDGLKRDYFFKLTFTKEDWATNLGFTGSAGQYSIIPCIIYVGLVADPQIKCEVNFVDVNYNTYIKIYGFEPLIASTNIEFHIPNIQNGALANLPGRILFEVCEETYGFEGISVTLYNRYMSVLTTKAFVGTNPSLTLSISSLTVQAVSSYSFSFSTIANVKYVIAKFPGVNSGYVDTFTTKKTTCGSNTCLYYTSINWMFLILTTPTTSVSFTIPLGEIKTKYWAGDCDFKVEAMDASGEGVASLTITKTFAASSYALSSFKNDASETVIYQLSEHMFVIKWTMSKLTSSESSILLTFAGLTTQTTSYFYCKMVGLTSSKIPGSISCSAASSTEIVITNINGLKANDNVEFYVYLNTGLLASQATASVSIKVYYDAYRSLLVQDESVTLVAPTYNNAKGMTRLKMSHFSQIGYVPKGKVTPFLFDLTPTSSNIDKIEVIFPAEFKNPSDPATDIPNCYYMNDEEESAVSCTMLTTPTLSYTITGLKTKSINRYLRWSLSTKRANPIDGIKHPTRSGYYNIKIRMKDDLDTILEQKSDYIFLAYSVDLKFTALTITAAHRTISEENIFIFEFTLGSTTGLNAYNHATDPGRIYLEFPVYFDATTVAFAQDLGTGYFTSKLIPCSFDGFTALATKKVQCRLVKNYLNKLGEYAKIEIINFDAIATSAVLKVRVAKIKNPTTVLANVEMRVTMIQEDLGTGYGNYEVLYQHALIFNINLDGTAPSTTVYDVDYSGGDLVLSATNGLTMNLYSGIGGLNSGDYVITKFPISSGGTVFGMIGLSDNTFLTCPATCSDCFSFFEGNMIAHKLTSTIAQAIASAASITGLSMIGTPNSYGENYFYSTIVQSGLVTHRVKHKLRKIINTTPGSLTATSVGPFRSSDSLTLTKSRKKTEILVSFMTATLVPVGGAILIKFSAEFTKVYGHCRSYTNTASNPSTLTSTLSDSIGDIACSVQSTTSWFITGFKEIAIGSLIKIFGTVDLSTTSPTKVEIITYLFQDLDLYTYSYAIDKADVTNPFTLDSSVPIQSNPSWTFKNFDFKMKSTKAPLDFFINSATVFTSSGKIEILLYKTKAYGASDWTHYSSTSTYICLIENLSTNEKVLCKFISAVETVATTTFTTFTINTIGTLAINTDYKVTLTTQFENQGLNGLSYPVVTGLYLAVIKLYPAGAASPTYWNNKYFETQEASFSKAVFKSLNPISAKKTLIYVSLTPTLTIPADGRIVIEFPTKSADGTFLFDDDLGLGASYYTGKDITVDFIVSSSTITLTCLIYMGDKTNYVPAKIVCGKFSTTITFAKTLDLFFEITNPTLTSGDSLNIPIIIYSATKDHKKLNYDVIEKGAYVMTTSETTTDITTLTTSLSNSNIDGSTSLTIAYPSGVSNIAYPNIYVISFSINLYTSASSTCSLTGCAVKYLQFLRKALVIPSAGNPIVAGTNIVLTAFRTAKYLLTASEKIIKSYVYFNGDGTYKEFEYKLVGLYPTLTKLSSLTIAVTSSSLEVNQLVGLNFVISGITSSFNHIQTLIIGFSNTFTILINSCYPFSYASSTNFEVLSCKIIIEGANNLVVIKMKFKTATFTSTSLSVRTEYQAIKNPSTGAIINFNLYGYAIDTESVTSDDGQSTFSTISLTISATNSVQRPDYLEIKDVACYQDGVMQDSDTSNYPNGQSWLKFRIMPSIAITTSSMLISISSDDMTFLSSISIGDISRKDIFCLINDVDYACSFSLSGSSNVITIAAVSLTIDTAYFVTIGFTEYFNTNLQTGFTASKYLSKLKITFNDGTNNVLYVESLKFPIKQDNLISQKSITYLSTKVGVMNYFALTFTLTTAVAAFVIEFPTKDEQGNNIFAVDLGRFIDGGEFPCEVNSDSFVSKRIWCIFKKGSATNLGRSAFIIVQGLTLTTGTLTLYLAGFNNPTDADRLVSLKVYGYSNAEAPTTESVIATINSAKINAASIYFASFENIFVTTSATRTTSTYTFTLSELDNLASASLTFPFAAQSSSMLMIQDISTNINCFLKRSRTDGKYALFGTLSSGLTSFYLFTTTVSSTSVSFANSGCKTHIGQSFKLFSDSVETTYTMLTTGLNSGVTSQFTTYQAVIASYSTAETGNFAIIKFNIPSPSSSVDFKSSNIIRIETSAVIFNPSGVYTKCFVLGSLLSSGSNKNVLCKYSINSAKNYIYISDYSTIFSTDIIIFLYFNTFTAGSSFNLKALIFYDSTSEGDASQIPIGTITSASSFTYSNNFNSLVVSGATWTYDSGNYYLQFSIKAPEVIDLLDSTNKYIAVGITRDFSYAAAGWTVNDLTKYSATIKTDDSSATGIPDDTLMTVSFITINTKTYLSISSPIDSGNVTPLKNWLLDAVYSFKIKFPYSFAKLWDYSCFDVKVVVSTTYQFNGIILDTPSIPFDAATDISSISSTVSTPTQLKVTVQFPSSTFTNLLITDNNMLLIEFLDNYSFDITLPADIKDFEIPCYAIQTSVLLGTCYGHLESDIYPKKSITFSFQTGVTMDGSSSLVLYVSKVKTPTITTGFVGINLKMITKNTFKQTKDGTEIHSIFKSTKAPSFSAAGSPAATTLAVTPAYGSRTSGSSVSSFAITYTASSLTNAYLYIDFDFAGPVTSSYTPILTCTSSDVIDFQLYGKSYSVMVAKLQNSNNAALTVSNLVIPSKIYFGSDYTIKAYVFDSTGAHIQSATLTTVASDLKGDANTGFADTPSLNYWNFLSTSLTVTGYSYTFCSVTLNNFDSSKVLYVIYTLNKLDTSSGCMVSTGSDDTLLRPFGCQVLRDANNDYMKITSEFTISISLPIKIQYVIKNEDPIIAPTLKYVKNYVSDTRYEEVSFLTATLAAAMTPSAVTLPTSITTLESSDRISVLPFYLQNYIGAAYNPFLIRFQISTAIPYSLNNYIKFKSSYSAFSSSYISAGCAMYCYFKLFENADTYYKTAFKTLIPQKACELQSTDLIVYLPSDGILANKLYEVVLTARNPGHSNKINGFSISTSTSNDKLETFIYKDSAVLHYSSDVLYKFKGNTAGKTGLALTAFYYTSSIQSATSALFLTFSLSQLTTAIESFPYGYYEISFPTGTNMFADDLGTGLTSSSEIPCQTSPNDVINQELMKCVLIKGDSTKSLPAIIRVDNLKTFDKSALSLTLLIEDIVLPAGSKAHLKAYYYYYSSSASDKSYFRAFADIMNIPLKAATLTLVTSTGTITPAQLGYGKTGNWATDSSLGQNFNKFSIKYTNGIVNYVKNSVTANLIPYLDSSVTLTSYKNKKTYKTYVLVASGSPTSYTLSINSVSNPTADLPTTAGTMVVNYYLGTELHTTRTYTTPTFTTISTASSPITALTVNLGITYSSNTEGFLTMTFSNSTAAINNLVELSVDSGTFKSCMPQLSDSSFLSLLWCQTAGSKIFAPINHDLTTATLKKFLVVFQNSGTSTVTFTAKYYMNGFLTETQTDASTLTLPSYSSSYTPAALLQFNYQYILPFLFASISTKYPTATSITYPILRLQLALTSALTTDSSIELTPATLSGFTPFKPKDYSANSPTLFCFIQKISSSYKLDLSYRSHSCSYDGTLFIFKIPRKSSGIAIGDYIVYLDHFDQTGIELSRIDKRLEIAAVIKDNAAAILQKDVIYIQSPSIPYSAISFFHTSLSVSEMNFPQFSLLLQSPLLSSFISSPSSSASLSFFIEFSPTYFPTDLGTSTTSYYSYKNSFTFPGEESDHDVSPALGSSKSLIQFGDSTGTWGRFCMPVHNAFSSSTYSFRFGGVVHPLVDLPMDLNIKVQLFSLEEPFGVSLLEWEGRNLWWVSAASVTTVNPTISLSTNTLASTGVSMTLTISGTTLSNANKNDLIMVRIIEGVKISSLSSIGVTGSFTLKYYSNMNAILLFPNSASASASFTLTGLELTDTMPISLKCTVATVVYSSNKVQKKGSIDTALASEVVLTAETLISTIAISSSTSFTAYEGLDNMGSKGSFIIDFALGVVHLNLMKIEIKIPTSLIPLTTFNLGDYCRIILPSAAGVNDDTTDNKIICYQSTSTKYIVEGIGALTSSSNFKAILYLEWAGTTPLILDSMKIYQTSLTYNTLTFANSPLTTSIFAKPTYFLFINLVAYRTFADLSGPLTFLVTPLETITFTVNTKLYLSIPVSFVIPTDVTRVAYVKYHLLTDTTFKTATISSSNIVGQDITIPLEIGYVLTAALVYKFTIYFEKIASGGILRPSPSLFKFYLSWEESSVIQAKMHHEWKLLPAESLTPFTVESLNPNRGQESVFKITATPDRDIANSDFNIWTEFSNEFLDTLGISAFSSVFYLSCSEPASNNLINTAKLQCVLWKGSAADHVLPIVKIPIDVAITTASAVSFFLGKVVNPGSSNPVLVTVKFMKKCRDDSFMCEFSYYVADYTPTTAVAIVYNSNTLLNPTRSINLANPQVLKTSATHAFNLKFTAQVENTDYIMLTYPINIRIPNTCTVNVGTCITFPIYNSILVKLTSTLASSTFLSSTFTLNNGFYVNYRDPAPDVNVIAFKGTTPYGVLDAQVFNEPVYSVIENGGSYSISVSIMTTRTFPTFSSNNLYTNFLNFIMLKAKGLLVSSDIVQIILLVTPSVGTDISGYFQDYCNATLNLDTPKRNDPYPYRLSCAKIANTKIAISGLPTYISEMANWEININFNLYIYGDQNTGTQKIIFTVSTVAVSDADAFVSKGEYKANLYPGVFPYIRDADFFTLSFHDRKGKPGEKVEFYMMMKPYTTSAIALINKIVFEVPNDFNYPAKQNVYCTIRTISTYDYQSCKLERILGRTLVTEVPTAYTNLKSLIKISYDYSYRNEDYLFTLPDIGGNNYVLKGYMYSTSLLVEVGIGNYSQIYPAPLAIPDLTIEPGLDATTLTLFTFTFTNGAFEISEGFPRLASSFYSSIILSFKTSNGYDFNLGTNQQNNTEIGCAPGSGMTITYTKKLTCYIKVATSYIDTLEVYVFGFDKIAALLTVTFYLSKIKTVAANSRISISLGVQRYYKEKYGIVYQYKPLDHLPPINTAFAGLAEVTATLSLLKEAIVLSKTSYYFTFTTTATVKSTDFIAIELPSEAFDKYIDDYTGATSSIAGEVFIFAGSSQIYFKPTSLMVAGTYNIEFGNIPSPPYASLIRKVNIKAWTLVDKKMTDRFNIDATIRAAACSSFTSFKQACDESYGLKSNKTLDFKFTLGHYVPAQGVLKITLAKLDEKASESIYGDLRKLSVECVLSNFPTDARCLLTSFEILVYLGNTILDRTKEYGVKLLHINIPNIDSSLYSNTFSSYYFLENENMICTKSYSIPIIIIVPVSNCQLTVTPTLTNMESITDYTFSISCPKIEDNSEIWIKLSKYYISFFSDNQLLDCYGSYALRSQICYVDKHTSNLDSYIVAKVFSVSGDFSFVIRNIKNPLLLVYPYKIDDFSFIMYSNTLKYAESTYTYPIVLTDKAGVVTEGAGAFYISRLYPNSYELTTYFFSVIREEELKSTPNQIKIEFPSDFGNQIGSNIKCGAYITDEPQFYKITDVKLLDWMTFVRQNKNIEQLHCAISDKNVLIYNIANLALSSSKKYLNIYLENIYNPTTVVLKTFKLSFSSNDKDIWTKSITNQLSVSSPPKLIQIQSITLSDYNVRNFAAYVFSIKFANSNFITTKDYPTIVIEFPTIYSEALSTNEQFYCKISLAYNQNRDPDCRILGNKIIIKSDTMISIAVDSFEIVYYKIQNPNQVTTCGINNDYLTQFKITMVEEATNNIIAKNSPNLDFVNCIAFIKSKYSIIISGPSKLYIGLSYIFNVTLEAPANGLNIFPQINGSSSDININPAKITFNNYQTSTQSFKVYSRVGALRGNYSISFPIEESNLENYYIRPFDNNFELLRADDEAFNLKKSLITFDDVNEIGVNGKTVIVNVNFEQKPSDAFFIKIEVKDLDLSTKIADRILDVNPTILNINEYTQTLSFELNSYKYGPKQTLLFSLGSQYSTKDIPFELEKNSTVILISNPKSGYSTMIFEIKSNSILKSSAQLDVYASERCIVYYILALRLSTSPSFDQIINANYPKTIVKGNLPSKIVYQDINYYIAGIELTGLEAETDYSLYAVASGMFNFSNIYKYNLKTVVMPYAANLKLYFLNNITFNEVKNNIASALRISSNRIYLFNDYKSSIPWNSENMKARTIIYEVTIAPDSTQDDKNPIYYAELMSTSEYKQKLKQISPLFNEDKPVIFYIYRPNDPIISSEPEMISIKYYDATIGINFVGQARVFAVRVPDYNLSNANATRTNPTSKQIFKGYDESNDVLNKTPYYVFRGTSDEKGYAEILFEDLLDGVTYDVYITGGNMVPYDPPALLADEDVKHIRFKTPTNKNFVRLKPLSRKTDINNKA